MPQVSDADLVEELAIARRELAEALGRQAATDDVLRVIASFQGDLHPVFDAILSNATRLCEASFGVLWNYDGERFHAAALHNVPQPFAEFVQKPMKPVPGGAFMRLIGGEAVVQIVDGANYKLYRSGAFLHWSYGFAVPQASPAKTFAEFVTLAKADPKVAFFASPSTGSQQHILGLQLGNLIGVKLDHVPFKGAADAINALLSSSVPSSILTLGELTNLHQSGKVRVLATLTTSRTADLPDVPTFTEIGHPQMLASGAVAMFGPAGMNPALTERLSKAVQAALSDQGVKAKILKMGIEARSSTPRELDDLDRSELARWGDVVKASGYVPE
jgi:Tripartite tricarboxylate transporter family receptor